MCIRDSNTTYQECREFPRCSSASATRSKVILSSGALLRSGTVEEAIQCKHVHHFDLLLAHTLHLGPRVCCQNCAQASGWGGSTWGGITCNKKLLGARIHRCLHQPCLPTPAGLVVSARLVHRLSGSAASDTQFVPVFGISMRYSAPRFPVLSQCRQSLSLIHISEPTRPY